MISDKRFKGLRERRDIVIEPYDERYLQPVSYDVHLSREALEYPYELHGHPLDLLDGPPEMMIRSIPSRSGLAMYLSPGAFMLGRTIERLTLSSYVAAKLDGKSTLGRVGLFVHATAGLIDPGWGMEVEGGSPITVELYNASPRAIRIWAGMPIGQLEFTELDEGVARPYGHAELGSHYAKDTSVAPSAGFTECNTATFEKRNRKR